MERTENVSISNEVKVLSLGPDKWARRYSGYIVNGFRFHTKQREERRKTQHSGVSLTANTQSYASSRDNRPITGEVIFYGKLTDIIELRYSNDYKLVLFKCDWVDNNFGKKEDEFKFTLVNFKHLLYKQNRASDEPFILASQAEQVWYVQDPLEEDWHVVVKMTPRDFYDMHGKEAAQDDITCPVAEPYSDQCLDDTTYMRDEDVPWVRADVDGTTIDDVGADCVDVDDSDEEDDEYYDDNSDDTYTDTDDDVDDDDPD